MMETRLLRLFQRQVRDQCTFFLMASHDAEMAHKAIVAGNTTKGGLDRFWFSIQNTTTAAANISKLLWGSAGKRSEERQPLRESLSVPDDSPLQSTDLRNHFEHFDERLDRWQRESEHGNYVDRIIGPPDTVTGDTIGPKDYFRHFDHYSGRVSFWGDTFDLPALGAAARILLAVAESESDKPMWDSSDEGGGQ